MSSQLAQIFERGLNPLRGYDGTHCLMKTAKLAAALRSAGTDVPAGRVVVLDDNGEFVTDRANAATLTAKKTAVPLFLWSPSDAPDVINDGKSPISGKTYYYAGFPDGTMSALVGLGDYELQTTEFDTAQTYLPNQALTSGTDGKLTNQSAAPFTDWICGICSWHENPRYDAPAGTGPVGTLANGLTSLTFWTYFLPSA